MTFPPKGFLSRDVPSYGLASGRLRGRTHPCSLSGVSGPYQGEGVTPQDLPL